MKRNKREQAHARGAEWEELTTFHNDVGDVISYEFLNQNP